MSKHGSAPQFPAFCIFICYQQNLTVSDVVTQTQFYTAEHG